MSKTPKGGSGRVPRGGGAGRAPGRDKIVGTAPNKWGTGSMPTGPRQPPPPPKGGRGK